ncbi:MAG TPA: nucleoside triphosphate hydrolase [Aestuariivirga sp.]
MEISALTAFLKRKASRNKRFMIGIAGPPASGKSTLAEQLREALGENAVVVPMDGFHYDDAILNARGHRTRKGAPHTYDVAGFEVLLKRIKAREVDIAIPVFDRSLELSRNAADIVSKEAKFILVEGNYLLLKLAPWKRLSPLFDFTLYIDLPEAELVRRLMQRWHEHGFDETYAKKWIASNDLPNIRVIQAGSANADLVV